MLQNVTPQGIGHGGILWDEVGNGKLNCGLD